MVRSPERLAFIGNHLPRLAEPGNNALVFPDSGRTMHLWKLSEFPCSLK